MTTAEGLADGMDTVFVDINTWITFAGIVVTGFVTWGASRYKAKSEMAVASRSAKVQEEAARLEAEAVRSGNRGPEWELFVREMKDHFESRLSAQDEKIGVLAGEVKGLRESVADFELRYGSSLRYIALWFHRHPETVALIEFPPEIADDLRKLQ